MIRVIIFINIINCSAFLYVSRVHVSVIVIITLIGFCQLQSEIQIRLLDTMHTMNIDMKNDKIH